jgi:hypothetical protein
MISTLAVRIVGSWQRRHLNNAGKKAECPSCGKELQIQGVTWSPGACVSGVVHSGASITQVVVTDVRIPILSMIVLMVKWAVASIPAFVILGVIGFVFAMVFSGGCAAILASSR